MFTPFQTILTPGFKHVHIYRFVAMNPREKLETSNYSTRHINTHTHTHIKNKKNSFRTSIFSKSKHSTNI